MKCYAGREVSRIHVVIFFCDLYPQTFSAQSVKLLRAAQPPPGTHFEQSLAMVFSILKLRAELDKIANLLEVLESIVGPILAEPGCRTCCIWRAQEDAETVLLLEEWATSSDLERHFRSPLYHRVLEAMEMSTTQPEVAFIEQGVVRGIEWVEQVRSKLKEGE